MKTKTVLGKILTIEMSTKRGLSEATLTGVVDDHEITYNPHVDDMAECDEDNADATVRV